MGLLDTIALNVVGGAVTYGTGGLGVGLVARALGLGSATIEGGSQALATIEGGSQAPAAIEGGSQAPAAIEGGSQAAAAAQSYFGNLVAGSIISKVTAADMVAPTP